MTDSKTQKIAALIEKLEKLKEAKEKYWSDVTEHIIEEVLLDLVDVEDYIVEHSKTGDYLGGELLMPTGAFAQDFMQEVRYAIKSPKHEDTNTLIQQLKIVEKRAEKAQKEELGSTENLGDGPPKDEKSTRAGRGRKEKENIVAVTIIEFMKQYCEPLSNRLLYSRKVSLFKANGGDIQLPDYIGVWKSGKPKRFNPVELKTNWPQYRKYLSNLPLLKQSQ